MHNARFHCESELLARLRPLSQLCLSDIVFLVYFSLPSTEDFVLILSANEMGHFMSLIKLDCKRSFDVKLNSV